MSEFTRITPTPEDFAAAIARAERRLGLVDMMMRFCMALLDALHLDEACALLVVARSRAFGAITRALFVGMQIEHETLASCAR